MPSNPPHQRSLLFVTGTRADFGKIEPLAIACRDAGFKITFFITGMHIMARYGETRLEVKRFVGAEFFEFVNQRAGDPQDFILAKTVMGFSDFVHEHRPDLVVIHGDRVEAMAAAIVCAMRYIPSAHIEGGEVSGTIDESIRHCNTKLCSSHFVSSEHAKNRVLALGESPDRIFVIGSPELDVHRAPSGVDLQTVKQRYDIPFQEYGIAVFHPVTSEQSSILQQADAFYSALTQSLKAYIVIMPNNDPGTDQIQDVISRLPTSHFKLIPSMRFAYFSELLKNARVIVGNSSAGVREAPFLGIPSLDVGSRQSNRANATSVTQCDPRDKAAILSFLRAQWGIRYDSDSGYGAGTASLSFLSTLLSVNFWDAPLQKGFQG
jgi:UDP-N-acetylglucosamine 2-epimerase (hydrolysing)